MTVVVIALMAPTELTLAVQPEPDPVVVAFAGTVSDVPIEVGSAFTLGDPASGVFTVNLATYDNDSDPNRAEYVYAPIGPSFQFGSYVASSEGGGQGDSVSVRNNIPDDYRMNSVQVAGSQVNDYVPTNLIFVLIDNSNMVFDDTTLPVDLDLAAFNQAWASIIFYKQGVSSPNVKATIASLSVTDLSDPGDILNDYDNWVNEGLLEGVTPNGLKNLRKRLQSALDNMDCKRLARTLSRVDGNPLPPDIAAGTNAPALATVIEGLFDLYGCT